MITQEQYPFGTGGNNGGTNLVNAIITYFLIILAVGGIVTLLIKMIEKHFRANK